MKFFHIFGLIGVFIRVNAASEEENIKMIYTKCMQETQVDPNDMEAFKKMELPNSDKGKCMMGCLMREASIISNGRFNREGATKIAEKYYTASAEDMEKARNVIDTCEKAVVDETQECELASKLAACVIQEAQKVGLGSVPSG